MRLAPLQRLSRLLSTLFPERSLHVHTQAGVRSWRLSPGGQAGIAGLAGLLALWLALSTAAVVHNAMAVNTAAESPRALYAQRLAVQVERRETALALLLAHAQGAPASLLLPAAPLAADSGVAVAQRMAAVRLDQERLLQTADFVARERADRLRLAFRLAGLNPAPWSPPFSGAGGPLIGLKNPLALAARLDIDAPFAARVERAAADISLARDLNAAVAALPLGRPAPTAVQSSGFGVRIDPFTGQPAFHSGLDFAGPAMTPIQATAPGVVSFSGPRSGYGETVEIDHGHGFKTRYGHLKVIEVSMGQRVALGQKIGAMGSTGRSTGDHLHYEVWLNGRAQNPLRFVRAGDYVQQTG